MKRMKKNFAALAVAALVAAIPISASAAEPTEYGKAGYEIGVETATESETESTEKEAVNEAQNANEGETENAWQSATESVNNKPAAEGESKEENKVESTAAEGTADGENESEDPPQKDGESGTEENGFEAIYDLVIEHLAEILSLCAFAASLLCAAVYKSGLLPLIERSLSAIGSTAQRIRESTEQGENMRRTEIEGLSEKLRDIEESLTSLAKNLAACSEQMEEKDITAARERRMEALITGELEMLYDVFMSSALPEYEKVRVGERVAKMKEVISADEKK